MSTPTFSVIIPTRDRHELLAECLERIAPGRQTLASDQYEVIVTDDGRTDAARAFVASRFPWARWSQGPRRGPASNRNSGAAAAVADVLVFLDDDCIPETDLLAGYFAALTDSVAVYEGRITCNDGITSPLQTAPLNLEGGALWSCNLAIRRSAFELVGGFDERFPLPHMEDVDLRERLLAAGNRIEFVRGASVDHPPRVLPFGTRLARMHQAAVLYMTLHPPRRRLLWFLQNTLRARVSQVAHKQWSADSIVAIASVPFELGAIAWCWRRWMRWADSVTQA